MKKWQKIISVTAGLALLLSPTTSLAFSRGGGGVHRPLPSGGGGGHSFTPRSGGGVERQHVSPVVKHPSRPGGGGGGQQHQPARKKDDHSGGVRPGSNSGSVRHNTVKPYNVPVPPHWHEGGSHPLPGPGPHPRPGPLPGPGPHPHPGPWPGPGPHPYPHPRPPYPPRPMPLPPTPYPYPVPYPYYPPPWGWDDDVWPAILPIWATTVVLTSAIDAADNDNNSGDTTVNVYEDGSTTTTTTSSSKGSTSASPATTATQVVPDVADTEAAPASGIYYDPQDQNWPQAVSMVTGSLWEYYTFAQKGLQNEPDWYKDLSKQLDAATAADFKGQSGQDLMRSQEALINNYLKENLVGIDQEGDQFYVMNKVDDDHRWSLAPSAPSIK